MHLDRKDKELLTLLYLDSRMSFVQMGKQLKLSPATVERRLRQLKKEGLVSLLFADVDFLKMGLRSYRIYSKFEAMDEKTEQEVMGFMHAYPRTLWATVCEGEYDVLWRIIAADEREVEEAVYLFMNRFGTRIVEKTVITTTYQLYLSWNKALESPRHKQLPMEKISPPEKVDGIDLKLLSALYADSRETTVALSKKVGLTPDAVQYRIRKLVERKFILGYTAWFDAKKLGFNYYKMLISFRNATKEDEKRFVDFCAQCDDVVFLNKAIGSWDIEADVIVRNNSELHEFTRDLKTRFGNVLGKYDFIAVIDEKMLNPLR
ncbi:MAG: Lrp/AsnC family transcriptional regulator [Candidatus Micrarchaeia archaeon]